MACLVEVAVLLVDFLRIFFRAGGLHPLLQDVVDTVLRHSCLDKAATRALHGGFHLLRGPLCLEVCEEHSLDRSNLLPIYLVVAFLVKVAILLVDFLRLVFLSELQPPLQDVVDTILRHSCLGKANMHTLHDDFHLLRRPFRLEVSKESILHPFDLLPIDLVMACLVEVAVLLVDLIGCLFLSNCELQPLLQDVVDTILRHSCLGKTTTRTLH